MKRQKWSKKRIIRELKKANERFNHSPRVSEVTKALVSACQRYFGSFNKAKKVAGLEVKQRHYSLPSSAYEPSKEFAWLVGYILGDGYLTTGYTIGAKTKDKDLKDFFIQTFKKWSNHNKFSVRYEKTRLCKFSNGIYKCERIFVIRVCFKEAYFLLKRFKDNPLYCLEFFGKEYWKHILKGLWDAEGHIRCDNEGRLRVGFTNYNKNVLEIYKTICLSLNLQPHCTERDIYLSNIHDILIFVDEIGITIKRKLSKIVRERIKKLKEMRKLYQKIIELRKTGLKRSQIWKKVNKKIPLGTIDGWIYSGKKPYCIENAKHKISIKY
jgi:intein-encoded DNA endonuclease-like protein